MHKPARQTFVSATWRAAALAISFVQPLLDQSLQKICLSPPPSFSRCRAAPRVMCSSSLAINASPEIYKLDHCTMQKFVAL